MAKKNQNQTVETNASVEDYLAAIPDDARRKDCETIVALMKKATKLKPKMWGPHIIGFGSYHYVYDSGREGDAPLIGFASRAGNIALYVLGEFPKQDELLAKLGKHSRAKVCLYIKRLADVDTKVLEQIMAASFVASKQRHGA